jgi:hypothetical protein
LPDRCLCSLCIHAWSRFIDRALYLPKGWTGDAARRRRGSCSGRHGLCHQAGAGGADDPAGISGRRPALWLQRTRFMVSATSSRSCGASWLSALGQGSVYFGLGGQASAGGGWHWAQKSPAILPLRHGNACRSHEGTKCTASRLGVPRTRRSPLVEYGRE